MVAVATGAIHDSITRLAPLYQREPRFWSKAHLRDSGCLEWTRQLNHSGYGAVRVGDQKWAAHRRAWQLAYGDIPPGLNVCHRCDNRKCIHPDHLFLGTQRDNLADMTAKGRRAVVQGEQHPFHKITADDVRAIRAGISAGATQMDMARRYGVSKAVVRRIVVRHAWAHVE